MKEWKLVAEDTWRLELGDGCLYRRTDSDQMVYAPCSTVSDSIYNLSETLGELRLLFEETTFEVNDKEGVRAIRNSDIGN